MQDYKLTINTYEDWKTQVIGSQVPVIVQFTASWCGPCKKQKPILEKFVSESGGKLKLAYADVDVPEFGDLADQFKITAIPGLVLIKNGVNVSTQQGSDEAKTNNFLQQAL